MKKLALAALVSISMVATVHGSSSISAGKEKSAVCQSCHGETGNSIGPDFPSLAEQQTSYIIKQLQDFQSGKRKNDTMQPMAASLNEQDMKDIAAYFASQKITPGTPAAGKEAIALGETLFQKGKSSDGIAACNGCHGANAKGHWASVFPALAGQRAEYIVAQLKNFRSSNRANDPMMLMRHQAVRLKDEQINALAAYLNSLAL